MGATVLVTGAAGFIGSHVARALAEAGHRVVAFDDLSTGHREALRFGQAVIADCRDGEALRGVLRGCRFDAALHFAAWSQVGESVEKPAEYHANNVGGARSLLAALEEAGVRALVLSSTAAVYGEPERIPVPEDHPLRPTSPYGANKVEIEAALEAAGRGFGLRSVALRYFNAAGAWRDGTLGEAHDPETHLLPRALAAAARGEALDLYGDDWPTRDGTPIRDYVHVMDLVDAHLLALDHLLSGGGSCVYNVGTGEGHTVREVLAAVAAAVGREVETRLAPRRPGDPAVLVASADAIRRDWGWRPLRPAVAEMARDAWRFLGPREGRARGGR